MTGVQRREHSNNSRDRGLGNGGLFQADLIQVQATIQQGQVIMYAVQESMTRLNEQ